VAWSFNQMEPKRGVIVLTERSNRHIVDAQICLAGTLIGKH
jgi:hypothetical protein